MNASVTQSWARIESWLAVHAPRTLADLDPPATAEEIAAAERAIGLTFPAALVESLLRHAGTGRVNMLPLWGLSDPAEIVREWRLLNGLWNDDADAKARLAQLDHDAEVDDLMWHPQWIPLGRDYGGGGLVIDLRANGRTGRIGERDRDEGTLFDDEELWRTSLPALLSELARCLETGEQFTGYAPKAEQGELLWDP